MRLINCAEPLKINIDALAARLPDEERLRIAEASVAAAFVLCPKKDNGEYLDSARLKLATLMNGCVTALLRSAAERQCTALWDRLRERVIASHGLH
jgi:hypothetical protein